MKTDNVEIALKAMENFAKIIDYPAVAALPIHVFPLSEDLFGTPAYTTSHGIFVREDIIEEEPENLPVYVAHEIGHHVVHNQELTFCYDPKTVNYAEDYIINALIHRLFNYDVRKLKVIRGLYNKKLGQMRCDVICSKLHKRFFLIKYKVDLNDGACTFRGASHPLIQQVAQHIRERYEIPNSPLPLFEYDRADDKKSEKALSDLYKVTQPLQMPVDSYELMKAMWLSCISDKMTPAHVVPGQQLTLAQYLAYTWDYKKKSDDHHYATLATAVYINTLSSVRQIVDNKLDNIDQQITHARRKWAGLHGIVQDKWRKGKRIPKEVWNKQRKLEEKIKQLRKLSDKFYAYVHMEPNAIAFMGNDPDILPYIPRRKSIPMPSVKSLSKTKKKSHSYRCKLTHFVSWINYLANKKLSKLIDLVDLFQGALENILSYEEESLPSKDKQSTKEVEIDVSSEWTSSRSQEQLDDMLKQLEEGEASEPVQATQKGTVETLLNLKEKELESLNNIMSYMAEFESTLTVKSSRQVDETIEKPAQIPHFGDDLSRLDIAEMALYAASEETKLLFLSKFAGGNLSVTAPIIQKRNAVTLCIDCSGSMQPKNYEIACGFALAMIKKLHAEQRGCALVIFHHHIVHEIVIEGDKSTFPLPRLIEALLNYEMGGTSFDHPLACAWLIKLRQQWKSMTTILITDGKAHVSDLVYSMISTHKTADDNLSVGLIGGTSFGAFRDLVDNNGKFALKKNGMDVQLTAIGNNVL